MADCHDLFSKYLDAISLPPGKAEKLMSAREAIRNLVRTHFKEMLETKQPKFHGQGSYSMKTIINPMDGEYDIDDGVYLQHLSSTDSSNWPTPAKVHGWLLDAVDGHTKEPPKDKDTCVRVRYAGDYHVDLPSYAVLHGRFMLADKGTGWRPSDPKAVLDWFRKRMKAKGEQLRAVVKYLKAWANFKEGKPCEMPSSLCLTVLAEEALVSSDRDDESLAATAAAISVRLAMSFVVSNPVDVTENLAKRLTEEQKTKFRERIAALAKNGNAAVGQQSKRAASELWRGELGDRFPLADKDDDARAAAPNIWVKAGAAAPTAAVDKKGGGRHA